MPNYDVGYQTHKQLATFPPMNWKINKNKMILVLLLILFMGSALQQIAKANNEGDAVDAWLDSEIKHQTVQEVSLTKRLNFKWFGASKHFTPEIGRFEDKEKDVTCWLVLLNNIVLDCIPNSQLKK
ncbi:MAG: hypothetical protein HY094_05335 [Candidatus Melainabacteria bacterium]|nr:hypothetical protein [Candidatus Melainabacteria bacterium]